MLKEEIGLAPLDMLALLLFVVCVSSCVMCGSLFVAFGCEAYKPLCHRFLDERKCSFLFFF